MGQPTQSAEKLFADALELEPPERQPFVDRACRGDPALQRLVEELLREDARAGSFLSWPLVGGGRKAGAAETASDLDCKEASEPTARFRAGESIAQRFLVVRFIARGGMGEVYEVEDRLLQGNRVALKIILPEIAAHEGSSHRFEQEVLLARKINHPNLCPIYEIFRCDETPPSFLFLTMKLLTGETLESSLRNRVLLPREEALEIFRQMIAGIEAIHNAGVVHRDIKPTNVMLDRSGLRLSVSIMDFGLARHYESDIALSKAGALAGTRGYLAPELFRGHPPSRASDIFALGVLLHEVLTGEQPVTSAGDVSVAAAPSLSAVPVPAVYTRTVCDFLSENPVVRCRAFERFRASMEEGWLHPDLRSYGRGWTRRQVLTASGAACCAIAAGAFWKRDSIADYLHPLPTKRFVALLGWPPSADAKIKPVLMGLIDSISSELARAEAYDHNLFLMPHFAPDVATPAQLDELRESLGANLVLATSGVRSPKDLKVSLQVFPPSSSHALRTKHIAVSHDEELSLVQKAVRAAAELLDIRHYEPSDKRSAPGTSNPEAYAAFQEAEAQRKEANDAGLERAIENYKQAIDLDPHYSLAIANLAVAYCRLAFLKHDPAAVALARANGETALALDPTLVPAHMALAFAFRQSGDAQAAIREMKKALALDPANTQTMVWQAQIYTHLNRWHEAEECYHRALRERPNYWLAHNELGVVLDAQGKYSQAESEFRAASLANPKFALALGNIGSVCLQLGRAPEAIVKLQQSLALRPNALASSNLSAALRSQGKLLPALGVARTATELDPGDSTTWLELGDCSSLVRGHDAEAKRAYRQAALVQREELNSDGTDGPGWILLALYEAKTGAKEDARAHLRIADSLPSGDLDSQMNKARILEILDSRDEALTILAECFKRGATPFQIELAPDMASLKRDPRYKSLLHQS
jgi:serine/threonine protein kinase/Tfp pilus assembly protein PilF